MRSVRPMNPIGLLIPRLRVLCAGWLLLASVASAQDMITEVVPAGFRSADELAAILRPLIPPPGSISGFHNQLVIKTTAANLVELRQLLLSLDKAPANLLVSVRRTLDSEISADLAQARLVLRSGDGQLRIGAQRNRVAGAGASVRGDGFGAAAQVQRRSVSKQDRSTQRIRVLEGAEAFIQTGNSIPVGDRQVINTANGAFVSEGIRYEEYGSGFWTLVRLNGDQVNLDIYPEQRRLRRDGSAAVQRASTSVSGTLSRWMEIGGVSSQAERNRSAIGNSRHITTRREHSIYVKVDRLD